MQMGPYDRPGAVFVSQSEELGDDSFGLCAMLSCCQSSTSAKWFQESTWRAIAAKGREAGRPSFSSCVILREALSEEANGSGNALYAITAAPYTYNELVSSGGFDRAPELFLYKGIGPSTTKNDVSSEDARLECRLGSNCP